MEKENIFEVKNLKVWFPIKNSIFSKTSGYVKAVDGVTMNIQKGETLGIVGESGCGKSTLGKALMLLEKPTGGQVYFNLGEESKDIVKFNKGEIFNFRKNVQMVFQDPYAAMNPMKKIYKSLEEPLLIHRVKGKEERERIMRETLKLVNIPTEYIFKYPHEFSGGQRQRICIARALEVNPDVVVLDEAVSALDVSIQAQVLNLLKKIQRERKLTYIFIAHDLAVVQYMSDRIAVMYLGKIVELSDSRELYDNALHPYTQSLLSAIPLPVLDKRKGRIILKGDVPSPINKPSGCAFHERCIYCKDICKKIEPPLMKVGDTEHYVACHLHNEES